MCDIGWTIYIVPTKQIDSISLFSRPLHSSFIDLITYESIFHQTAQLQIQPNARALQPDIFLNDFLAFSLTGNIWIRSKSTQNVWTCDIITSQDCRYCKSSRTSATTSYLSSHLHILKLFQPVKMKATDCPPFNSKSRSPPPNLYNGQTNSFHDRKIAHLTSTGACTVGHSYPAVDVSQSPWPRATTQPVAPNSNCHQDWLSVSDVLSSHVINHRLERTVVQGAYHE